MLDLIYTVKVDIRYEEAQKFINEFKSMKTLGKGAFSKVKHAIRQYMDSGELKEQEYALKVMHKPSLKKCRDSEYTKDGDIINTNALEKVYTEIGKFKVLLIVIL